MTTKTGRAKPLSPEQRRTAILDAVIPLLVERGATVTTAEMAEAAGADAIVAVRYTTSTIASGVSEILAFGTAVKLR